MADDFTWVTANDPELEHNEEIDKGGYGTVHKVRKYVPETRANRACIDPQ